MSIKRIKNIAKKIAGRVSTFFEDLSFPNIYFVFPRRKAEPKEESARKKDSPKKQEVISRPPALFLDTSAIIDGRIADVVKTGFLDGTLVVTSFVLNELQKVADSKSTLKRNRGRRGLEILEELKDSKELPFQLLDVPLARGQEEDQALVKIAKKYNGKVVTVDYNLYKVGRVAGARVINVNELANMVKTILLPGEEIKLKIIQEGKEPSQGVGYLPDGTMVVVKDAEKLIGKEIKIEIKRVLQTDAGRMLFGQKA